MSYDTFRHLADSWGLAFMTLLFVTFIGWTFRPGAKQHLDDAAQMIFKDDDNV